jgi:uncharacterized membrane protein
MIVLGMYSSSDIRITQTYHLQAPVSLIWQHLTDAQNVPVWINQFKVQDCENDTNDCIICYSDYPSKNVVFKIFKIEENKSLQLQLNKNRLNPYINYYSMNVYLKSLRDGTTEINCELNYHLDNIFAKIINKLYFESHQKNLMEKNLKSLHNYFEKV